MRKRLHIPSGILSLMLALLTTCGAPLAPQNLDLAAKQLQPDGNTALVYVYRTWAFRQSGQAMPVLANGTAVGDLDTSTYLYFRTYPGELRIEAWSAALNLNAHAGSSYYVRFDLETYGGNHLDLVSDAEGRGTIASLRLVSMPVAQTIETASHRYQAALNAAEEVKRKETDDALRRQLAQCETKRSGACFRKVLTQCTDCSVRLQALASLAATIKRGKDPLAGFRQYVKDYPDGMELVPLEHRLYLSGPPGLTIYDVLQMKKKGMSNRRLADKIRSSASTYKEFTAQEVSLLRKKGLPDDVIEAMVQSTQKSSDRNGQKAAAAATEGAVRVR